MQGCKIGYLPNGYFKQLEIINNVLFTAREIDIIACVINMRGSSKIASILDISPRTAETHIVNIKQKINNNAREGIIDFVERSSKSYLIRKHYQTLLVQTDFNKKLKSIANTIHNNTPSCYFLCCNEQSKGSIIPAIQNHLKLADIKLNICSIHEEILEHCTEPKHQQKKHFIYVISTKVNYQSIILKALEESKRKPNLFTFLVIESINPDLAKELVGIPYINFAECENYYLTIFEIFKRLSPRINFEDIISQLNCYQQSVTDQQGLIEGKNHSRSIEKPIAYNYGLLAKISTHNKWLGVILFIPIVTLGYNKIVLKEPKQKEKETNQLLLSKTNYQFAITSYVPEILTGYEHFIGRQKELKQIEQKLNEDNIVIITGPGGVGKSSCAIEYGKRNKRNKIVRYLNAEFITKIDQHYRELAQELNINADQQPRNVVMQLVNNKLNTLATKILFVFDNVEQSDEVKEYLVNLPQNIQAIITTRRPKLVTNIHHLVLEEFSNEEAEKYINNSLQNRHLNEQFINYIIEDTGALPYDIKCITAYLLDNPSMEINKMNPKDISNKIKNKLFQEFIIKTDHTTQHAWKILQYAANLDPDFISIEIINKLFPENIELSSAALKKLESLSLISIINDQNHQTGFRIHRKLQKNVYSSTKHNPEYSINRQSLVGNLLNGLDRLFPEVTHGQNIEWQVATSLQQHVAKLLNTEKNALTEQDKIHHANLYYKLAKYHLRANVSYQKALGYAKTSLKERRDLSTKNQADLANSFNIIGVIYRRLGNIKEGLKYSQKGLKIRQLLYSGDHPDIEDSLKHVATAYLQNGETQQGLKYSQMALEMSQRLYSGNHYEIASSLNTVGMCYLDLGDFKKSLEYIIASLNMFTALKPVNYERVAALQSNLSYNYNKLDNHVEALKYAKASVDIFKNFYPNGHPRAIYSLGDFGYSLLIANKIHDGLEVLNQALNMSKNFNMDRHYVTAHVLHDLGWGYLKNRDYKTALEYGEKALNLRKEMYSNAKNHPELAESLHNLGDIHCALGNKNHGLVLYKEALSMYLALSLEHLTEFSEIKQKIAQQENTVTVSG